MIGYSDLATNYDFVVFGYVFFLGVGGLHQWLGYADHGNCGM